MSQLPSVKATHASPDLLINAAELTNRDEEHVLMLWKQRCQDRIDGLRNISKSLTILIKTCNFKAEIAAAANEVFADFVGHM